ncbi:hypothetical protein KY359_05355 [Candidatus Woesearchaeota archaeon]|nr:hypothetical protein [Candidatus Woesearchaeota archaeon]
MAGKKSVIETGVDKLVRLVAESKKISVKDAAKELGVSVASIEDWADFLEEEGIISIQTQFATVYLVEKRISKKDLVEKVKAVKDEKEQFLRRVESSINALQRDHEELKLTDAEFRKIKGMLEDNFSKLGKKLEKLEDFRKSHRDIDLKRKEIEQDYEARIKAVEDKLKKEQKEYHDIIAGVEQELAEIKKEREKIEQMKTSEKELQSKVAEVDRMLSHSRKEIEKENEQLALDEERLKKSELSAKKVKEEIESSSKELDAVSVKLKSSHKDLEKLEQDFIKDVESLGKGDLDKIGAYKESKDMVEKLKKFFSQTKEIDDMILKAEKEEEDLKQHFDGLLKKVQAFSVVTSVPEIKNELDSLHKELEAIESRKHVLGSQLKKLRSAIRSVTGK